MRKNCLPCETKLKDEKVKKKSYSNINLVYKTWCQTCYVRDSSPTPALSEDPGMVGAEAPVRPRLVAGVGDGGDGECGRGEKEKRTDVRQYLYIGETCRSA